MSFQRHSLRGIELLRGLSEPEIAAVEKECRWRDLEAGEQVAASNERLRHVYLVVSGRIRVFIYTETGKAILFQDVTAGSLIGELSAIDGLPTSTNFEASEPTEIACLDRAVLRELIDRHSSVRWALMSHLSRRLRLATMRIVEISAFSVRDRIHAELRRLGRRGGSDREGVLVSPMPTHAEIAARVNTHREAVSRELSYLARLGIIERTGRDLRIVRPDLLQDANVEEG